VWPRERSGDDTIVGVALPSDFGRAEGGDLGGRGLLQYA
jgi:hypothetical protein